MMTPAKSLRELLELESDESTLELFGRAEHLYRQVDELSDNLRSELARRLKEAWPEEGFGSLVTLKEARSLTIQWTGVAWLFYGPALDIDLEPSQWAEIACSGATFTDQEDWLRRKWSPEAATEVVRICDSDDARVWGRILTATPGELPDVIVTALVERLRTFDEAHVYDLGWIGERLAREQRVDALRSVAQVSDGFMAQLRPHLARVGDGESLRLLLEDLRIRLDAGEKVDRDSLEWLQGAADAMYLDELFECLIAAHRQPSDPFGPIGSLQSIVGAIGGEGVVARYDQIIADRPFEGAQFTRFQRERVAQALLKSRGSAHVGALAGLVEVPLLENRE